jgi:hypothetical protein
VTRLRVLASLGVVLLAVVVASFGATWAAEDPPPSLERDGTGTLFSDVELTPGVPVSRCATLRPRGGALESLTFDGTATGSLAPAVALAVVRGVAPAGDGSCAGFVPEETVYDGPLDALPSAATPVSSAVAVAADTTMAYRATIELTTALAGTTRFGLRVTGVFGDDAVQGASATKPDRVPDAPPAGAGTGTRGPTAAPGSAATAPPHCLQRRSSARVGRTVRRGRDRLEVRTPSSLPLTVVRPLPVYVRSSAARRPVLLAGGRRVALRRVGADRWRGYVPLRLLAGRKGFAVRGGDGLRTDVPVLTRRCDARLRSFVRREGTVDLRIDAGAEVRGAVLTTSPRLGRARPLVITAAGTDARSRPWRRSGRPGTRGLPRVRVAGRRLEITDLAPRTTTVAVRVAFRGRDARTLRGATCSPAAAIDGEVVTVGTLRRQATLTLEGDRCRGAY